MVTRKHPHFERDDESFPADAYRVREKRDLSLVAWRVLGWETEPDEDTHWTGQEVRTGRVVCIMVGDDSRFTFDPDDLVPIAREAYCGVCGQMGCGHDGLDRSTENDDA